MVEPALSSRFPPTEDGGLRSFVSELLAGEGALRHRFFGRAGGVSQGGFASLNVSRSVGDDHDHVEANRALLRAALRLPSAPVLVRQVHGDDVALVDERHLEAYLAAPPEADALITSIPRVPLAVHTADCVSVIMLDRERPALGLVHAGWRGTAKAAVSKTLRSMAKSFGTDPSSCVAAIGPSIAGPCYEVGAEVREALMKSVGSGGDVFTPGRPGRWYADLREANRRQLLEAGLRSDRVAVCPYCTHCEEGWFFSARRGPVPTGRQATVAMLA